MSAAHPDESIVIVDYDPQWPAQYEEERTRIEPAIASFAMSIEHIGSTSVPGLCAKPIVDIMVTVERFGPSDRYIPTLAALGYTFRDDPANTDRHAFGRRAFRSHNLHIVQHAGPEHRRHIAFRDYLCAHPEAVREYGELKRRLAAAYGSDRDGYTNAKTAFVRSIESLRP